MSKARPSIAKRRKEAARKERQRAKAERRAQREAEKTQRTDLAPGEDPDIAGIVPGPQPLPWELEPPRHETESDEDAE